MKLKTTLITAALISGILSSCKKEDPDVIKPVFTSVLINGTTGSVSACAGSTLSFTMAVTDNEALNQVKIDIHDVFDGHSHRNTPFSTQKIYTVEGTSATIQPTIAIPSNAAAGPYHVILYLIDKAGNEAPFIERELEITQTGQAVINITSHDISLEHDYSLGDTIFLAGEITDDIDLEGIEIVLKNESTETDVYDEDFDLSASTVTSWDFNELTTQSKWIIIPTTGGTGHYHLMIKAVDSDNNLTIVEMHVHVD